MLTIFSDYYSGAKMILELHNVEINEGMQIFVKCYTGKTKTVFCKHNDIILELKLKLIALGEEAPPDEQRIIFSSKQLDDWRTISDYNIHKECTVVMILRLRGGK